MVKIFSPKRLLSETIAIAEVPLTYQNEQGGYRLSKLDDENVLLTTLYVHPEHRGKNYSTDLLKHAIEKSGDKSIHLTVKAFGVDKDRFDNERLIRLYERNGFKKSNSMPKDIFDLIGTYMIYEKGGDHGN